MGAEYFYPIHFDSSKMRKQGRRFNCAMCHPNMKYSELVDAARLGGIDFTAEEDKRHPQSDVLGRIRLKELGNKKDVAQKIYVGVKAVREKNASEKKSCYASKKRTKGKKYIYVPKKKKPKHIW